MGSLSWPSASAPGRGSVYVMLGHLCVIDRAKALELEPYTDSESDGRQP